MIWRRRPALGSEQGTVSWLIGSRCPIGVAPVPWLVDEHVGEPAHAAIIGDPGATHPTISPSRPDRRLSPRMTPPAVARRVGRDPAVCRAAPATTSTPSSRPPPCVAWVEGSRRRGGPPALVLGFARLPEHRIAEAVRLLAEAAAATWAGRVH
jgi:hypothetical protein